MDHFPTPTSWPSNHSVVVDPVHFCVFFDHLKIMKWDQKEGPFFHVFRGKNGK